MTSDSYHTYLIESLRDPEEAAAYLEAILEEENPEPELLGKALNNIAEALGDRMTPSEQITLKTHLNQLLETQGNQAVHALGNWLQEFGLKLTIVADSANSEAADDPQKE